jgi:multiple sugar transport system substrate-binding protein
MATTNPISSDKPVSSDASITQKIDVMEQSMAADLQQGKSPDPSTQTAVEDAAILKDQLSKSPAAPPVSVSPPSSPPPPPPPPPPAVSPSGGNQTPVSVTPKRKSKLGVFIFVFLGIAVVIGLAIATGLMSRIVPQLGFGTTTLTYWGLWEPETVVRPILDDFEKSHPGIKVNYIMQSPQEYRERLQSALSQSKEPDIFRIHNTWVPMFRPQLAPVPADVYSASDFDKTFYAVARSDLRVGNNYVAIPLEYDGIAMYINDELLAKSGQKVPQDWDQLRDVALAMSECASQTGACTLDSKILVSGVALGTTENIDHWEDIIAVLMLQNNVNLGNPASPTTKAAEDVLEYYTGFVKTYHIWDPNLPSSTVDFAAGRLGIYFGPSWRIFDILSQNPDLKFSVHPIPQLPVDASRGETPITYAGYWAEAVNQKSTHSKQAWELLKYLSSPDVLQKLYHQEIDPTRLFGEPYGRVDLADSLKDTKYVNTFIGQAPLAKSWYLASFTRDGQSGLNTRLSALFADAVARTKSVTVLATEINRVLSDYGLAAPIPTQGGLAP